MVSCRKSGRASAKKSKSSPSPQAPPEHRLYVETDAPKAYNFLENVYIPLAVMAFGRTRGRRILNMLPLGWSTGDWSPYFPVLTFRRTRRGRMSANWLIRCLNEHVARRVKA
jgi:hypothetical protein